MWDKRKLRHPFNAEFGIFGIIGNLGLNAKFGEKAVSIFLFDFRTFDTNRNLGLNAIFYIYANFGINGMNIIFLLSCSNTDF